MLAIMLHMLAPDINKLLHQVTSAPSTNSFKAKLDKRNNTATIVQTGRHRLGTDQGVMSNCSVGYLH